MFSIITARRPAFWYSRASAAACFAIAATEREALGVPGSAATWTHPMRARSAPNSGRVVC